MSVRVRAEDVRLAEVLERELPPGRVFRQVPMSRLTTYRVGGPADVVVVPRSTRELAQAVRILHDHDSPYVVLGQGSNVLVADEGIGEPVVLTTRLGCMGGEDSTLWAEAGVHCTDLALVALERSLTGLEFFYKLPGSVGGAVFMNARAFGQEVSQVVRRAEVVKEDGRVETVALAPEMFSYKKSPFMGSGDILAKVWFELEPGDRDAIHERMEANRRHRQRNGEDLYPSCGCVFKNPPGVSAGKLIEGCGLKGRRLGSAWVSGRHANFVLHRGEASARELRSLMEIVRQEVARGAGVELEYEVRFLGRW